MSFLSEQERAELRAQHKRERDRRICDRIKAVLLKDKGWSIPQIAEALLLSQDAIRNHLADYQSARKLKPEAKGSREMLTEEESRILEQHLSEHIYLYVKNIASWIKYKWGKAYSISGLTDWLRRHGFSYKKPAVVPGKANSEAQEKWIEEYGNLKAQLPESETICFIDGVHPTHNVQPVYGWMKRGEAVAVSSNTGRSRLNIAGAIDVISHKLIVQEDRTLNADATISFFARIEAAYPSMEKIHVFCDNAAYYRNKLVTSYLESSKIELHFLPPYSPNLNPIERLWKWMKEVVVYNTYYQEFEDFRHAVFGFFSLLSPLDLDSELGAKLKRRVRDRFRSVRAPVN